MFKFILPIVLLITLIHISRGDIPESEEYGPIIRPVNPSTARDILGYDNFQRTAKNSGNVRYGNNWEKYDTDSGEDYRYNSNYRSRDYDTDRRDYRDRYDRYDDDYDNRRQYRQY